MRRARPSGTMRRALHLTDRLSARGGADIHPFGVIDARAAALEPAAALGGAQGRCDAGDAGLSTIRKVSDPGRASAAIRPGLRA